MWRSRLTLPVFALALLATAGAAEAQTAKLPLVAVLDPGSAASPGRAVPAFLGRLRELGWVEGQTVAVTIRYGEWQPDRLANAAAELVRLKPDVLFTHGDPAVLAAKTASRTVPIVVGASTDLVEIGAVSSLARPGGNVTGMTFVLPVLDKKRLEVLKEVVPKSTRVGALITDTVAGSYARSLEDAARVLGVRLLMAHVRGPDEIDPALTTVIKQGADALLIQDTALLARERARIAARAIQHRLPSISQSPGFAEAGGLLQYGADVLDLFRRSAGHADKILRGAKPADLPVEQPTKLELIVNLKTAKSIGLAIPPSLQARADQVLN